MPKPAAYTLIWSEESKTYVLLSLEHPPQAFDPGNEEPWFAWLITHSSFSFQGQCGHLNVLKEARARGTGYWYAYHTVDHRARKRYLGHIAHMTFAHLEQVAQDLGSRPISRPETNDALSSEHRGVLLSAKLSAPRLPPFLVERSRLLRELDAVRSYPLTLVSAPAGSGKTTLLSAWAATFSSPARRSSSGETRAREPLMQEAQQALAWLSLEELDNEPVRFWDSVIAALRTCLPTIGETALTLLHSPQSCPLSTLLLDLLKDVEQVGRELVFILDDYQTLSDQNIRESLYFFLEHLPANAHLVLLTRADPDLPLPRLRIRAQLLEIRDHDLRFTQQEAASFLLQAKRLPLSEEDVALLHQRTEGWIAGLQLAALALSRREDVSSFLKDFAGSHRYLLDYVQQDILAQLPVALRDFVLHTSILARMNAAACQAVTAHPSQQECQDMLQACEQANLFLVPLDDQRQWYRFHDLFREALQAHLQAREPDRVPLLHIRAARFYEMREAWREAVTHALAAADHSYAAELIEHAAFPFWVNGESRTILTWVLSLPDAVLCSHTRLTLGAALRSLSAVQNSGETLFHSTASLVEQLLARLQALVHNTPDPTLFDTKGTLIERRLRLLYALIEARGIFKRGDRERLRQLTQEVKALPPDTEVTWDVLPLSFAFWLMYTYEGNGAFLVPALREARLRAIETGDHLAKLQVMCRLALAYESAGQLHRAYRQSLEALALVEQISDRTSMAGYLYHSLFHVTYAWNRLEEASDWLNSLVRQAQESQQAELLILGEVDRAALGLARGDLSTAHEALHRLGTFLEQEGFAAYVHWVQVIHIQVWLWLAQGNLACAAEWAAQTTLSPKTWDPFDKEAVLMLVHVSLAQQQYTQAIETLGRFREHLDQPGNVRITIHFLALEVAALFHAGKREQAQAVAARLFALTEPEGSLRVYLDLGQPMREALAGLLAESATGPLALSRPYISRLLVAFEQEDRKRAHLASAHSHQPMEPESPHVPASPLTRAEQQILRLLVAGQTYAEMAQALVVSPNTVKTQVSSIYRKLGVNRRAEAIALSQRLHLL